MRISRGNHHQINKFIPLKALSKTDRHIIKDHTSHLTDRRTDDIKDAYNNGENYFDTDIPKKFENWTKNTKDMGKYVKHIKIAKTC